MVLKTRYALILFKEGKLEAFENLIGLLLKRFNIKKLSWWIKKKDGWIIAQFKQNMFATYRKFDNYLWALSEEMSKADLGLVLGHNDYDGHFWYDFPSKKSETFETKSFPDVMVKIIGVLTVDPISGQKYVEAKEIRSRLLFKCKKCGAVFDEDGKEAEDVL